MFRLSGVWICLAVLWTGFFSTHERASAQGVIPVDLELVLAVDTSGSVDTREYELQIEGLVKAFRDPAVIAAISVPAHQVELP